MKNDDVSTRLEMLEARVSILEKGAPKRGKPILVMKDGICGVEPAIDSATCPYANVYRRQRGCLGDGCVRASSEYYKTYRATKGDGD